ncbi:unnamed protein product, partial [Rotaria magnacalcarata]
TCKIQLIYLYGLHLIERLVEQKVSIVEQLIQQ